MSMDDIRKSLTKKAFDEASIPYGLAAIATVSYDPVTGNIIIRYRGRED